MNHSAFVKVLSVLDYLLLCILSSVCRGSFWCVSSSDTEVQRRMSNWN